MRESNPRGPASSYKSISVFLALVFVSVVLAEAGGSCAPGVIASPASFSGTIRPALAEDLDPDPGVVEIYLNALETTWSYKPGIRTTVWTYNGVLPGPTIEAHVGDRLIVHFCNSLPEASTIHWHGVHLPAVMDGSNISQRMVEPGESFTYDFQLLRAGTYWYHPHNRTHRQVELGLHGVLVVRDTIEDYLLGLPSNDHILVLDDVSLDQLGQVTEPFIGDREAVAMEKLNGREGEEPVLNGRINPTLELDKQVLHRLRMVNVANSRFMRMSVSNQSFWRIGGDQGLIEAPIKIDPVPDVRHPPQPNPVSGLLLTPGERADILFFPVPDGPDPLTFEWHDWQRGRHSVDFMPDGTVTMAHNVPDGTLPPIEYASILLTGDSDAQIFVIPPTLKTLTPIDASAAPALPLMFGHTMPDWDTGDVTFWVQGPMNPMGKPFDTLTPDDVHTVVANRTYRWEVRNMTGGHHNFHTHGFHFQHIETEFVDTDFPADPEGNYTETASHLEDKDTILIRRRPGTVRGSSWSITRLAVTFDDTGREGAVFAAGLTPAASTSGGWLAHCHLLEHSASGMMTFFQVLSPDIFDDGFESSDLTAWPIVVP